MFNPVSKKKVQDLLETREDGSLFHRESQTLEFKENFNFAGLGEYFRDFAAFANNKGGYLIFGVKDRPRRIISGLTQNSKEQLESLDPEKISGGILEYFSSEIEWVHEVYEIYRKTVAVFYTYKAKSKPVICKKDGGSNQEIKNGEVYFRYGGRTQKIQAGELEIIINDRIKETNRQWQNLVQRIGDAGAQNAAILDTEKGIINKSKSQKLIIDENLLDKINWIRQGEFSETEGEKTLRVVGDVETMNQVEVIQKVTQDKLREYPLSATELADKIVEQNSSIRKNDVWKIISDNDIKNMPDYSVYNFRNMKHEKEYIETGQLPSNTPSIYKSSAINYIIRIFENEKSGSV